MSQAEAPPIAMDQELGPEPFTALHYHLGMLLGVKDLEVEQAYHRSKVQLHNAWLHRPGVVWGYNATPLKDSEVHVAPGLALDGRGRELYLDRPMYIDVKAWAKRAQEAARRGKGVLDGVGAITEQPKDILIRVVAIYRACLGREVPALSGDEARGTAPSRVRDDVELRLLAGPAADSPLFPEPLPEGFWRLRQLLGLERGEKPAESQREEVGSIDGLRTRWASLPQTERLRELSRLAAADVADVGPRMDSFHTRLHLPAWGRTDEYDGVVLATVSGVQAVRRSEGVTLELGGPIAVNIAARSVHLPTSLLQLALCALGPQVGGTAGSSPVPTASPAAPIASGPAALPAPVGPQVLRESVTIKGKTLRFKTTQPLDLDSIENETLQVWSLDPEKKTWVQHGLDRDELTQSDGGSVAVKLWNYPLAGASSVRLMLRGVGPRVVLGEKGAPLAGAAGEDRGGSEHDGLNFVHKVK